MAADSLREAGIEVRKKDQPFVMANGQTITRNLGYAIIRSGDFETIRLTGHNLYGSGAAYGLDDISWIGAGIESAAQSADKQKLERLIAELREFLARMHVS